MRVAVISRVAVAWSCLLVSACGRTPTSASLDLGGPSGTITWLPIVENVKPLPGIDQGSIYHPGTAFVIWCDAGGGGGGSASENMHGIKSRGSLLARDRRRVEFHCETKDGKTGQVKIDGIAYELSNGNLFLVSTEGDKSLVKQLKRDLSTLKFERESLEAFARNDADIAGFFTKAAKPK